MKTRILVAVLLSSALAATGAQAQFMFIEGLPGEVTRAGLEETHELALYAHAVQIPIDPASGQFTGVRLHSPIIVKKKFNLSSPLLYRASTNGEVLPSVEFRFYRTDNRGAEVEYFNVELENAYVVSFATQSTAQDDPFTRPEDTPVLEEITLTYRRITWTYVEGGITHTDDWAVLSGAGHRRAGGPGQGVQPGERKKNARNQCER